MGDPFDDPTHGAPSGATALREPSVLQAVTFLNDPRVKGADPAKALTFLRGKGITDDELREAYRRCGVPFPATPTPPFAAPQFQYGPGLVPPFGHPAGPVAPFHPPPPARPSWVSVFLGITAAAGLYTAVREVLKRYVVPMYFPDAARIAEERRRRDEMTLQAQELQIAELRERVQELLETSKKTNEKVENLSASVSSSMALRERELSQNSELRDAIRQLSHSVTASGGTDTSRVGKDSLPETSSGAGYLPFVNGKQAHKHGSLAYSHVDQLNGSLVPHVEESHSRHLQTSLAHFNEEHDVYPSAKKSTNAVSEKSAVSIHASQKGDESSARGNDDDFMAIAPAEVEESWASGLARNRDDLGKTESPKANWEHSDRQDAEEERPSAEVESVARHDGLTAHDVDGLHGDSMDLRESTTTSAARQLFQKDLMNEANLVLGGSSHGRARPLSMPQMDTPLSEGED